MVKRYTDGEEKLHIVTDQLANMYHCPDCGFEYNAQHKEDDKEGGYICPLCESAEKEKVIKELTRIIARNLVAWDTSKDKRQGLLPEVYLSNKYWYKQLTGEEY